MPLDRDALKAWVEHTCAVQGVPVLVTDAGVIARVGVLLRGGSAQGGSSRQGAQPGGEPLTAATSA